MKLDENLHICLLSVASRYPDCLVEIQEDVLDTVSLWKGEYTAEQAMQYLQNHLPQLLQAQACLRIDEQEAESGIYLPERSQEQPAFHLSCESWNGEQRRKHMLHEPLLTFSNGESQ